MTILKKLVYLGCFALSACMLEENKNFELIEDNSDNSSNKSPCNYKDSAMINADSFFGKIGQKSVYTGWDYYEVRLDGSWGHLVVVTFKGGIRPQKTKVIDLATNYGYSIRYAIGANWEYKSVSGKLYCVVNPDNSIKCDWCDVKMKGHSGDFSMARGGFTLK